MDEDLTLEKFGEKIKSLLKQKEPGKEWFWTFRAILDVTTKNKTNGDLMTKLLKAQLRTQEMILTIKRKM